MVSPCSIPLRQTWDSTSVFKFHHYPHAIWGIFRSAKILHYKKGPICDSQKFRSITHTSILAIFMGRIFKDQLIGFRTFNESTGKSQHGFLYLMPFWVVSDPVNKWLQENSHYNHLSWHSHGWQNCFILRCTLISPNPLKSLLSTWPDTNPSLHPNLSPKLRVPLQQTQVTSCSPISLPAQLYPVHIIICHMTPSKTK